MAPPTLIFARFILLFFALNLLHRANGQEDEGQEGFIVGDLSQYTTNGVCNTSWIASISASETHQLSSSLLYQVPDIFSPSISSKK
jgi:hypothetical protein